MKTISDDNLNWRSKSLFIQEFLEVLRNFSNWKKYLKVSNFFGVILFSWLKDVYHILDFCMMDLELLSSP